MESWYQNLSPYVNDKEFPLRGGKKDLPPVLIGLKNIRHLIFMPIQLFCFGFGIKFEYLVLIGFEIDFFKSDMPVNINK